MTPPAEHCGHQPDCTIGRPTECVLRPGHSGSHTDNTGMRWWMARLPEPARRPTASTITDEQLDRLNAERDRYRSAWASARERAAKAAVRIARGRAAAETLISSGCPWSGNEQQAGRDVLDALDRQEP